MAERIYKLQPDRTLHLRGFDGFGAAAALHSATPDSFKVSGVFRDPADFAVLVLHDADDFYEHPSIRYLPDFDFAGLTLSFDVHYSGLMPLDSPKWPSIAWPELGVTPPPSKPVLLFDHAVQVGGEHVCAQGMFTIANNGMKEYDRLTLWYLNSAFDYIVPKVECAYAFYGGTVGKVHSVVADGQKYSYTEKDGDSSASIAQGLATALAGSPAVNARAGDGSSELGPTNQLNIRPRRDDGLPVNVSSSVDPTVFTLYGVGAATVARDLAAQINAVNWQDVILPLAAEASGSQLTVRSVRPGVDGNSITMYSVSKNNRLTTEENWVRFRGGSSDATWRITLDFSALGISSARQLWLTFAPALSVGQAFEPREWQATFTNWTLSGPEDRKLLCVAGPGSVRVEDDDSRCKLDGNWTIESGFYTRGFARCSKTRNDRITVSYDCAAKHDLYLGTSLYSDRGRFQVQIDTGGTFELDTALESDAAVVTRRLLASGIGPGLHTVKLTVLDGKPVYFDFLEAAVRSDIPAPLAARTNASPALDYSTDHTYKLSPARLMWNFDQLGFAGPMNEYIGVFWWNQRIRSGGSLPCARVEFGGVFAPGDQIFIDIGGQIAGKTVFPNESNEILAGHFAAFVNATYVGVWAKSQDNVLTITGHSAAPSYSYSFAAHVDPAQGSTGTLSSSGRLDGGVAPEWVIDPSINPTLNRGARDWHSDFFGQCANRNRPITVACSMELVNPPAAFPARYPDSAPVETQVGFGSLKSTHCAFNSAVLEYKQRVFGDIADLMKSAGVTPDLQFGEFCWWYFPQGGGMAFYDDETKSAASTSLRRPLQVFRSADDDPAINGGDDASFLRDRLRDHVSALIAYVRSRHSDARFEVLYPYDVNYPHPVGMNSLGGRLLRFINLPHEWEQKEASGLDRLKMEGLDFGAYTRNLDLAADVMQFPLHSGWPKESVRYMIPVFNGGCPWVREYRLADSLGISAVNFWAFDHFCIFGWDVTELDRNARAMRV